MSARCPRCGSPGFIEANDRETYDGTEHHNMRCPDRHCNETWLHVPGEPFNVPRMSAGKEVACRS